MKRLLRWLFNGLAASVAPWAFDVAAVASALLLAVFVVSWVASYEAYGMRFWEMANADGLPYGYQLNGTDGWLVYRRFDEQISFHTVPLVPFWLAIVATAPLPLIRLRLLIRRLKSTQPGHCPECGYDLRATPERCPECGRVPAGKGAT